jgi:hypothetical protein
VVVQRLEVTVDVTEAVGTGERLATRATVVVPERGDIRDRPVAFFGFPGGGYTRHYYDLHPPGHSGYSQAEHHARDGDVFVCCDHLAVGDSDVPDVALDFEAVGRANAATAREVMARLRRGELDGALRPIDPAAMIGMGQSYGGFVLTIGQAVDPCFDAVAMLGWSGIETIPPWPDDVDIAAIVAGTAGDGMDHPMRPVFHFDDEPVDLVVMDMTRGGSMGSAKAWGAANAPGGPAVVGDRAPLGPGVVAAEAAAISVPVLVACGEVDVVGDPWAEPTAYRGSRDVTVVVFEQMAHMHNFASSRERLWARLASWARAVGDLAATGQLPGPASRSTSSASTSRDARP